MGRMRYGHRPGVLLNGALQFLKIVGIHEGGGDAVLRKGMRQQVVAAAVDGLLCHHMTAVGRQSLDGVGDGRGAGGKSQCGTAALQGRHSLLQNVLGGVGQTAVDVAGIRKTEAVGGVLAVMKNIGCGLVNGNGSGIGGGIGLFLSYVKLQGLKTIVRHGCNLL